MDPPILASRHKHGGGVVIHYDIMIWLNLKGEGFIIARSTGITVSTRQHGRKCERFHAGCGKVGTGHGVTGYSSCKTGMLTGGGVE